MLIINVLADAQKYLEPQTLLFFLYNQRIEGTTVISRHIEYSVTLHTNYDIIAVTITFQLRMLIDIEEYLFQTKNQFILKGVGTDVLPVVLTAVAQVERAAATRKLFIAFLVNDILRFSCISLRIRTSMYGLQ